MSPISKSRQRLARRLASRRGREREGLALVEGPSVILEALRSGVEVRWVLVGEEFCGGERGMAIVTGGRERGAEVGIAADAEVRALCSTEAPRAAVACVRPPPLATRSLERGRFLMARGVQIPGNLGTLIRSAWAFGLDGVVVGAGTVDPWNPKVVRGSAGGVFHVALIGEPAGLDTGLAAGVATGPGAGVETDPGAGVETDLVPGVDTGLVAGVDRGLAAGVETDLVAAAGPNFLCADASGEPVEVVAGAGLRDWVLVVGNEGGGIPAALAARARAVAVPLVRGVDSLNVGVAGSILMYALMRAGEGGADE